MQILMISDVYFPRINGVSTSIKTFMDELYKLGHEITLIAPEYSGCKDTIFEVENNIIRIPASKVLFDPEDRLMKSGKIKALLPYLAKKNFDIIHIHTPFLAHYLGLWLAENLKIPSVETYHTFFEEYFHHYIPFVPKSLTRFVAKYISKRECNQVDQVIVPSTAMREILCNYGVTSSIDILPTGIPLKQFGCGNGERFRKKYKIEMERPMMITVGRVAYEKNLNFLLQVLLEIRKQIPEILFVIAGDGPMLPHLKYWVERNGVTESVRFVGYLDRKTELQDCYHAADVFVFASRTETQGLVLLEAMAEGVPVVSTAVLGTADVLQDQHGCLVSEENYEAFSARVCRILETRSLKKKLIDSGKAYAEKWTADCFAEKLMNIYSDLTEKSELEYDSRLKQLSDTVS